MKITRLFASVLALGLVAVATLAWAASGDPDTSFSGDGVFTFGLVNPAEEGGTLGAVDPSGRLLVGDGMYGSNMAVARVLPAGGLDASFGGGITQLSDGKVRMTNAVGVQPDGKVLAAGNGSAGANVFLVRYRANGSPDTTFGADGVAHVKMCGTTAYETNVFVRSDGSIVVAGDCGNGSTSDRLFVLVFKPNGNPDPTFSGDGQFVLQLGDDFWLRDAVLDGHDRLTIVGSSTVNTGPKRASVVRVTPKGTLDRTFSGDGTALFTPAYDNDARAVELRQGGGVLVAEQASPSSFASSNILLFALTVGGKLDTSFSGDGQATIDVVPFDTPRDLTIDGTGRIYVAATFAYSAVNEASVIRTKPNGSIDTTFSGDGIAHTGIASDAWGVTIWKGKPTVVGNADFTTDFDALVARFLA